MSSNVDISFAISAHGVSANLSRLLRSFADQAGSLSFEILVGRLENPGALKGNRSVEAPGLPRSFTLVGSNLGHLRNHLYAQARGRVVYFIDEDCALPADFLRKLARVLRPAHAMGGFYLAPKGSRIWPRAYNSLANLWLKSHHAAGQTLAVAGNVLIPRIDHFPSEFPFNPRHAFGGEEIALAQNLRNHDIPLVLEPQLSLWHHCAHSARVFWSRSRLHGSRAHQPLSLPRSLPVVLAHLAQEKSLLLPPLLFGYMLNVWCMRWWKGAVNLKWLT